MLENVVVETFLLNRICHNFFMFYSRILDLLPVTFIRKIYKTSVPICATPDIKWTSPGIRQQID